MPLSELVPFVFFDVLLAYLVIPFQNQIVLTAVEVFGGYPIYLVVLSALAAGMIATIVNRFLGYFIATAFKLRESRFVIRLREKLNHNIWLITFVIAIPFLGSVVTVLAGVFSLSNKKIMLYAMVGYAIYFVLFFTL